MSRSAAGKKKFKPHHLEDQQALFDSRFSSNPAVMRTKAEFEKYVHNRHGYIRSLTALYKLAEGFAHRKIAREVLEKLGHDPGKRTAKIPRFLKGKLAIRVKERIAKDGRFGYGIDHVDVLQRPKFPNKAGRGRPGKGVTSHLERMYRCMKRDTRPTIHAFAEMASTQVLSFFDVSPDDPLAAEITAPIKNAALEMRNEKTPDEQCIVRIMAFYHSVNEEMEKLARVNPRAERKARKEVLKGLGLPELAGNEPFERFKLRMERIRNSDQSI